MALPQYKMNGDDVLEQADVTRERLDWLHSRDRDSTGHGCEGKIAWASLPRRGRGQLAAQATESLPVSRLT